MQTEAVFESIADHISIELEQAESSIYIAVAWLTNRKLFNILLEKAQQGIIDIIRRLEAEGKITIASGGDDVLV